MKRAIVIGNIMGVTSINRDRDYVSVDFKLPDGPDPDGVFGGLTMDEWQEGVRVGVAIFKIEEPDE